MKNHIAVKFIAIVLCALCLLGAVGGAACIIGLSEMDLYNKTVDEYRAGQERDNARNYASQVAMSYSSKILGGCPEDMFRVYYGDTDWFIRSYPNHAYTVADSEGKVLSSYNMDAAQNQGWLTYEFPVSGNYLYLVDAKSGVETEEPQIPRTVEAGVEYLYDAIQPMGSTVYGVTTGYPGGSASYGSDTSVGFIFKDESGRVIFRGFEPGVDPDSLELNYFKCVDGEGEIIYEVSSPDTVGRMTTDENGFPVFTGNLPEPEETVPQTTAATVPETTGAVTEPEATDEDDNHDETETQETTATVETGEPSSASAVPEEGETPENVEETVVSFTEETAAPETEPETVSPTTAPVETVPDIEVTEPVMVGDKPLSSYQINRIEYSDSMTGQHMTAKYVYVPMPELTVTLYVGDNDRDAAAWNLVRVVRDSRQILLPLVGICLLGIAVTAVYLCSAAGRKPGVPEVRASGLNRIPLDVYLVGGGCLIARCVAGGLALFQYLLNSDIFTACCIGIGLCYLGCLVFVGFCFAFVAQIKTPGGYWWRNTLCGWCLRLCVRFAVWLEGILSTKAFPELVCLLKKLWNFICRAGRWTDKRVNRFISYLPLVWQWLAVGALCGFFVLATRGRSVWPWLLWALAICYGAYCFGKLMDSASRMSKGDLDIKVDDKHMVGAFSQFAESLNNLAGVTMDAAQRRLKSERMKTELITNVSHDIKTPLTSIINYVDLLQKAQTEEERKEYLEVLDRQSQRLKKLIDDLMDMSKASTGNMTVDVSRVDAVEAVNQALGEFADKLDRAMLVPVFRHDDLSLPMMADGRLVWRVLSNLLSNAVKYAMPGTRLYIDLSKIGDKVILSMKNISREELNIGAEELMERFVRGDDSRNTEGSGLGLNIAKSLMELQKGELQLLVDGDLFKVTLIFPAI